MDGFLTPRVAAAMLGLSVRTLKQYRWKGKGPAYYKFGGLVRYRVSDLMEWNETPGVRAGGKWGRRRKRQVHPVEAPLEPGRGPR